MTNSRTIQIRDYKIAVYGKAKQLLIKQVDLMPKRQYWLQGGNQFINYLTMIRRNIRTFRRLV